ncbi:substrate-binding periplasmic protein [Desulfonema magnum]|nr:transporter substrate-binding domain-containing protein [Desulfonema magnum]
MNFVTALKIFIFCLFCLNLMLSVAQARTLKMVHIESEPFYFTNESGKSQGILIDLVDKVMKKAGYQWNTISYPAKRMVQSIVRGDADMWLGLPTLPGFKGTTVIGRHEIAKATQCAYTKGENPPIINKEDLSGKTLITLIGYSYGGWIHYIKNPANHVKYHEVFSNDLAFKMLRAKRADYLLSYKRVSEIILKKMDFPELRFNEISAMGLKFVVSKKNA